MFLRLCLRIVAVTVCNHISNLHYRGGNCSRLHEVFKLRASTQEHMIPELQARRRNGHCQPEQHRRFDGYGVTRAWSSICFHFGKRRKTSGSVLTSTKLLSSPITARNPSSKRCTARLRNFATVLGPGSSNILTFSSLVIVVVSLRTSWTVHSYSETSWQQ